jgi:hypothetical protein
MQKFFVAPILLSAALLASCGGDAPPPSAARNSNAPANSNAQTSIAHGPTTPNPGIATSHGSGVNAAAPAAPPVQTPEMDAKIQKAEAKAKAAGASEANFFRDAGDPKLYRFALRDYRIGLRYDPTAQDSRAKMDEIVQIYQSMGRPVPDLGNEQ